MRRVVVTGVGVITPLGCELETFRQRLFAGTSGIRTIQQFDASAFDARIAGEVIEFNADDFISVKEQRRLDRFTHYALAAAQLAVRHCGAELNRIDLDRAGAIVGSGIGGLQTLEKQHEILRTRGPARNSPFMIPQMICNIAAGMIAIEHGLRGPNYAAISACATAAHCIGDAMHIIRRGEADLMLAGGAEASVCPLGISGFAAMKALSTRNDEPERASRPFDRDRDGFVMGEGAAVVVLEELEHARARGADIFCELVGFGMSCDAHHMTAPAEGGEGAARAITAALKDAGVAAESVDYINAHGTSTQLNDRGETAAIKRALGETKARSLMVSSTKSMTGHLLGAAAGLEAVVCALAIRDQVVPPTINYDTPDPDCDLDYVPNEARAADVKVCLNNSLGFGGHNTCMVLRALA